MSLLETSSYYSCFKATSCRYYSQHIICSTVVLHISDCYEKIQLPHVTCKSICSELCSKSVVNGIYEPYQSFLSVLLATKT